MRPIVHSALVLTGAAAFFAVLAWLILSKTPAVDTAPPAVDDTAVETPEAGEVPPSQPASGAPLDFDDHVDQALAVANDRPAPEQFAHAIADDLPHGHAFCAPCRAVLCVRSAADVVAHLRTHYEAPEQAADWVAWESERQDQS